MQYPLCSIWRNRIAVCVEFAVGALDLIEIFYPFFLFQTVHTLLL
jgi:hypothetical protein